MSYACDLTTSTVLSPAPLSSRRRTAALSTDRARCRNPARRSALSLPFVNAHHSSHRRLPTADPPSPTAPLPSRLSRPSDVASGAACARLRLRQPAVCLRPRPRRRPGARGSRHSAQRETRLDDEEFTRDRAVSRAHHRDCRDHDRLRTRVPRRRHAATYRPS